MLDRQSARHAPAVSARSDASSSRACRHPSSAARLHRTNLNDIVERRRIGRGACGVLHAAPAVRIPPSSIPDVPLGELVLRGASAYPNGRHSWTPCRAAPLTFGELRRAGAPRAAGLSRRIRKGDVVAIWAPNVPEYAVVFHAVARLGAILTTVNPAYTNEEVTFQLRDSGARLLVTTARVGVARARGGRGAALPLDDRHASTTRPDLPSLDSIALDAEPPDVAIDPATDVVALPYSSGTTGPAQGRDAHPPQPRGQSGPDRRHRGAATSRPSPACCRSSTSTAWS